MNDAAVRSATMARAMWTLFEPVHGVTYFAPEARAAFEDAGVRGFWRGDCAGRAGTFTPPWKSPPTRPRPGPGPASARPPWPAWPGP